MADAKRHSKDKLLAIVLWFAVLGAAGPGTALARQGTEDARLETATVRHLRQSTIPGAERADLPDAALLAQVAQPAPLAATMMAFLESHGLE